MVIPWGATVAVLGIVDIVLRSNEFARMARLSEPPTAPSRASPYPPARTNPFATQPFAC